MIKAHFSERIISSGINDVAFTSVHSEKTNLKKLMMMKMMMMMIMNKSQETTVFSGRQKPPLTKARKVMVDFSLMLYICR